MSFLDFMIGDMMDADFNVADDDMKDFIRYSEFRTRLIAEANQPANLGTIALPQGTIYCGGMTVRQVMDHIADHLVYPDDDDESRFFCGLDDNNHAVIEWAANDEE
jgi:hypothetical protein